MLLKRNNLDSKTPDWFIESLDFNLLANSLRPIIKSDKGIKTGKFFQGDVEGDYLLVYCRLG